MGIQPALTTSMNIKVSWSGKVDVDVVRRVVGPVVGQLDPFAADLERVLAGEDDLRGGPGRVVVPQQQSPGLRVPDAYEIVAEQVGRAGVVGVVMGVDDVGHRVTQALGLRDLVHGPSQVVADGRRGVEQHHPVGRGEERRLVGAVGDPEEVALDAADEVPLVVQGRAEGGLRHRGVVRQLWRTVRHALHS